MWLQRSLHGLAVCGTDLLRYGDAREHRCTGTIRFDIHFTTELTEAFLHSPDTYSRST